ncbi:hypothetical protein E1301_Tti021202 [Triplophysa tibetana]|uniref:Uncharacterized protein n=1 Tax=Triplophysa tibetana TaxID=1572043 RepID=A0A5A9MXZ5_9TELE|nr:hypothetical protein E1301_Tti021202 [Triplophysa tibetana]
MFSSYKRVDADGHPRQYATAINVPKVQCQAGFNPSQKNFLTQEDAKNVRNVIGDESTALYQGQQLIAAGNKNREHPKKKNEIVQIHSESLLLNPPKNPPGNSPMTNLLNRNKQNCSVFYTLNSPCVDTCLNEKGPYSILKALDSWKKHSGIKAFVFKEFWKFDLEKDLQSKFKLVASRVPLYRCVTETKCYACKGEGNDPIDQNCLPPKTNKP